MDCLFVSLQSTPETRGLFDRERLQSLKSGASIINLGRGSMFDHPASASLQASGH
jgi:glyoxylate/hydroxypyruvate reductase A